jgi:hypothetical protein
MTGSLDLDPIVIPGGKLKATALVVGGAIFVAIGVAVVRGGNSSGWWAIGFFGLCAAVGVVQLIPGTNQLTIDRTGITVRTLFRPWNILWADVDSFYVAQLKTGLATNTLIGIHYSHTFQRMATGRRVAYAMTGVEAAIPNAYAMKADNLCNLLNDCKKKWG